MAAARKKAKAKTKSKAKRGTKRSAKKKAARSTQPKRKAAKVKRPKRDTRTTAPLEEMDAAWQSLLATALERHRVERAESTTGSKRTRKK